MVTKLLYLLYKIPIETKCIGPNVPELLYFLKNMGNYIEVVPECLLTIDHLSSKIAIITN